MSDKDCYLGIERRQEERKEPLREIKLDSQGKIEKMSPYEIKILCNSNVSGEGIIINLSKKGLKIAVNTIFFANQKVNLTFLLPITLTGEQEPIFMFCRVVWQNEGKEYLRDKIVHLMGVEILEMLPEHREIYDAFLESLSAMKIVR